MDETRICGRCFSPVRLADAEFREEPDARDGQPDRTVTRRLHVQCAELSDRAVEMGRRLGGGNVSEQAAW